MNHSPMDKFWDPIVKHEILKIIVGNQFAPRFQRVAVGNWDVMSVAKIISYLSKRAPKLDIFIPDPVSYFDWKEQKEEADQLINEWSGSDLIVIGSPDANNATAMVLDKIYDLYNEKRIVVKEQKKEQINLFPSQLREFLSNNTTLIHNFCKFKDHCHRTASPEKKTANKQFRQLRGIIFSTPKKKSNNEEFIVGICDWFFQDNGENVTKYVGFGQLLITNNIFCSDDCSCRNGSGRHKLILINGLTGPTTLDITKFLCGFNNENEFQQLRNDLIRAIENPGDFSEFIVFTGFLSMKKLNENLDRREPEGLIDFIKIRDHSGMIFRKNLIALSFQGDLITLNNFEDLDVDLQKLMSEIKILDVLIETEGNYEKIDKFLKQRNLTPEDLLSLTMVSKTESELENLLRNSVFNLPLEEKDPNLVSVLMPFSNKFDPVYEKIKEATSQVGLICKRADDIWAPGIIINQIFKLVYRSSIVIADLTDQNSNVFYECGIAHTLGKNVIPITQNIKDMPFDVRHIRLVKYENSKKGLEDLKNILKDALEQIKKDLLYF